MSQSSPSYLSKWWFQFKLLFEKNVTLMRRNRGASACQLLVGLIFMFVLFVFESGLESSSTADFAEVFDAPLEKLAYAQCNVVEGYDSCLTAVYAPDNNATRAIMELVAAKYDSQLGAGEGDVRGFDSAEEMEDFLFENPRITDVGVSFTTYGDSLLPPLPPGVGGTVQYAVHYNQSRRCEQLNIFNCIDATEAYLVPMQAAVDDALLRTLGDVDSSSLEVSFQQMPHGELPRRFNIMSQFGNNLLFAAVMINFAVQLNFLVKEKESKLRESMKQMGMVDSAYFASWMALFILFNTAVVLVLTAFGAAFQHDLFVQNAYGAIFLLFWLVANAMTCGAFALTTVVGKAQQAQTLGITLFFVFFIFGSILQQVFFTCGATCDYGDEYRQLLGLLAPLLYYKGFADLNAEALNGLRWEDHTRNNFYWPLSTTYSWLLLDSAIYLFLAWYLDNVLPNEYGRRNPPWFFATRAYWLGSNADSAGGSSSGEGSGLPAELRNEAVKGIRQLDCEDDDVASEAKMVRDGSYGDREVAVELIGLTRRFQTLSERVKGAKPFTAVDGISYAIDRGQLFCLLGHNGAGKSTTFNMLTGLMPLSAGEATLFGHSIRSDMGEIRRWMGVCPQHDVLWDELTGREHLRLFAQLRNLDPATVEGEVDARLDEVQLSDVGDVASGAYSGGMRRRLSVAIAMIGDPRIVFLDEPTTGMDPVTRRGVWDIIERAKKGRIIVLTTHSMEEADILGDRIAVMSHGQLQCIGNALRLKNRYGTGYHLTILMGDGADDDCRNAAEEVIMTALPDAIRSEQTADNVLAFRVPEEHEDAELADVFASLEERKEELSIASFTVRLTTLEEVFLELSHRDGGSATHAPPGSEVEMKEKKADK